MTEVKFPQGMRIFPPNPKAPEWIIGDIVINKKDFAELYNADPTDPEIRLTLKRGKSGSLYLEVNDWRPSQQNGN